MKICVKEENRERIEERKCVRCKYCVDLPEIGVFVSCMVACGVVGFVLMAFSAP